MEFQHSNALMSTTTSSPFTRKRLSEHHALVEAHKREKKKANLHLLDLPPELLQFIIQFLAVGELRVVRRVCTSLNEIVRVTSFFFYGLTFFFYLFFFHSVARYLLICLHKRYSPSMFRQEFHLWCPPSLPPNRAQLQNAFLTSPLHILAFIVSVFATTRSALAAYVIFNASLDSLPSSSIAVVQALIRLQHCCMHEYFLFFLGLHTFFISYIFQEFEIPACTYRPHAAALDSSGWGFTHWRINFAPLALFVAHTNALQRVVHLIARSPRLSQAPRNFSPARSDASFVFVALLAKTSSVDSRTNSPAHQLCLCSMAHKA